MTQQHDEFEESVAEEIRECPESPYEEIGRRFKLTAGRIAQIAVAHKVRRKRGPKARKG